MAVNRDRDIDEIKKAEAEAGRRKRNRVIIVIALIIIALSAAGIWAFIINLKTYESYEIVSSSGDVNPEDRYESFKNGVIRYSQNGIKYENTSGKLLWDHGASMKEPALSFSADYGLFYDINGSSAVLFDDTGVVTSFSTMLPIAAAGVSDYGVSVFMTQDGTVSSVYFYDDTGRKLDIEVRNVLAKNSGYPISMTVSPSGTGLALSLVFIDRGAVKTRISFLNFDSGKDSTDRVVGYFEYDDILFPEIRYLSSEKVAAFGDDRVVFYSLSNETSPRVITEVQFNEEITSVFTGTGCVGVVTKASDGGHVLYLYDSDGSPVLEKSFEMPYSYAGFSNGYALIYGGTTCLIVTESGRVKYWGETDGSTTYMTSTGAGSFLQYGDYGMRTIKLK
ncbi:MAG: hypothetical protein IKR26_02590 [Lachnospiraceae bacterium]|nr:hypothetical protein [Lachnospiraceae bacterium]